MNSTTLRILPRSWSLFSLQPSARILASSTTNQKAARWLSGTTDKAALSQQQPQQQQQTQKTTNQKTAVNKTPDTEPTKAAAKKTMAQLDEELREKLEGRSGNGGAAGLELENGQPVAMKRGVRENMFRLI